MFQEIPKNCRYAYARVSSKSQEENSFLPLMDEVSRLEEDRRKPLLVHLLSIYGNDFNVFNGNDANAMLKDKKKLNQFLMHVYSSSKSEYINSWEYLYLY